MGFTTPVLINNDTFHEIKDNPERFVEEINRLMNTGGRTRSSANVLMASHSSQFRLLAVKHTQLIELDRYSASFRNLAESNPEYARGVLEKARDQINEALTLLPPKSNVEIERRFLISDKIPVSVRKSAPWVAIRQGYFQCSDITVRIRSVSNGKGYITLKGPKKGASCNEFEYEIPRDDAELLIKKYCSSYLTKRRYTIPHGDLEIELDVFTGSMAGLVIAEIELPTKNTKFDIPEWFGKEITEDRFYSNRSIAARNMKHDD